MGSTEISPISAIASMIGFTLPAGLASIRRSFLPAELEALVQTADVAATARVETLLPFRVAVIGGPALA